MQRSLGVVFEAIGRSLAHARGSLRATTVREWFSERLGGRFAYARGSLRSHDRKGVVFEAIGRSLAYARGSLRTITVREWFSRRLGGRLVTRAARNLLLIRSAIRALACELSARAT